MRLAKFFLLAITLLMLNACSEQPQSVDKLAKKHAPAEHLLFQRAYPDLTVGLRAMDDALDAVKLHAEGQSRSADLPWTVQGPHNIGGRLNTVALHPNNSEEIWVGASAGGVFRSMDNGDSWEALTDDFGQLPIGCIVFDPLHPDTVYVGTGDPQISGLPHIGDGLYRTVDGGENWVHIGLTAQRIIPKVVIHPDDPNTIYAATMGLPFERDFNRGLYRSTDFGVSWEQILNISDESGVIDFVMHKTNPDTLFAAVWPRIRNHQESLISGNEARIHRSTDGGDTWEELANGLPETEVCRIGFTQSGENPDRMWAVVISTDYSVEGIYRTDNAGDTWGNVVSAPEQLFGALGGFGWYFAKIRVNPTNDLEMCLLGVDMWVTYDGGQNWELGTPPWWMYEVHADKHDLLYLNNNEVLLATDGGLYRSTDHFENWTDVDNIPNTQFYRIALNPHNPGYFTGGAQDNGTTTGNIDGIEDWSRDYGGDGFQAIYDPIDDEIVYYETQNGGLAVRIGGFTSGFTGGIGEDDRTNWDSPIIMSAHDNQRMYTGTFRVYRHNSAPFGSWNVISGDLTDGVIFGDNFHNISTVGESRVDEEVIYAGTSDGNVWRSLNSGDDWANITDGLPERYVTNIKTSPEDGLTVYVTHSGYKDNDQTAHIHKSTDAGDTWQDITGDMPEHPVNHIEVWNDSIHFVATDAGVYFTANAGVNWERVGNNMPIIPVFDIEIDTVNHLLVAGTFARSIQTFPVDSLVILPEIGTPIGVQEQAQNRAIQIFPSPVEDFLNFSRTIDGRVDVFNIAGQRVISREMKSTQGMAVNELNPGQYVIVIEIDGQKSVQRFMKL
jgi:photosystem II stability/assembly factor-like uncharacterized protein